MDQVLKAGQTVRAETSGLACEVGELLGSGGQGEVYRATLGGRPVALKWYLPAAATAEQRAALEVLIKKGRPAERFLWPLELVSAPGVAGFGYVMPLRERRYRGIADLMKRRIDPTFRALATAGLALADSFLQLHARGLCYRDISFGNVFIDPDTGDVLICDNDNVAVDGEGCGGVLGTPRFMAPEVVRGDARPSTQTDLFSLAVLLFYLLMMHHPLEGAREAAIRCLDLPAMTRLYGTEPVFIFDPHDTSNRPLPGCHDNALAFWPIYPQFLRDLFTKAFTAGIHDPQHGRVRESEWRSAMARLRDAIVYCGHCGAEQFYDAERLHAATAAPLPTTSAAMAGHAHRPPAAPSTPFEARPANPGHNGQASDPGGAAGPCWACGRSSALPPRLHVGRHVVMLNHDARLYPHHVDEQRLYDFSQPVAAVTRHPAHPSIWGLKNLSQENWVISGMDGLRDVPPGRSVTLTPGLRIHFGRTQGEVHA
jgi:hypothetical protein